MMRKIVLLLFAGLGAACQKSAIEPENKPNLRTLSAAEVQVSRGTNNFAFDLYQSLNGSSSENSAISPLSVGIALGMVLNGAAEDTRQSILNTIDFADFSAAEVNEAYHGLTKLLVEMDKKVTLGIANSVWYNHQYSVNPDFASVIQQEYDGTVQGLNFGSEAARTTINAWVEDKTNQRIKDLIQSISPDEVMFLVNTVYFKSDWTYRFDKSQTHEAPFTTIDGTTSPVNMMRSKGATIGYYQNDDLRMLTIPYGNKQFNFTIVVPHSDFHEVISGMDISLLNQWLDQSDTVTVELELPRFKMTWKKDLKETLGKMGMKMKGFPNLLETPEELEISRVVHQTYLDVNEEGSEAAAATSIGVVVTSLPQEPTRITIDKPFLFMIRENHSGTILFMGQFVKPE